MKKFAFCCSVAASFHLLICDVDLKELKPGSISRKRGEERQGKEKNRKERGGGGSIARAQEQRRWERMWNETWDRERKETSGKNRQLKKRNVGDTMKKLEKAGKTRGDDMIWWEKVVWDEKVEHQDEVMLWYCLWPYCHRQHQIIYLSSMYPVCLFLCVSHPKIETPLSLELLSVSFCTKVWPIVSFPQSLSPLIFLVKDLHQLYKIQKEAERK